MTHNSSPHLSLWKRKEVLWNWQRIPMKKFPLTQQANPQMASWCVIYVEKPWQPKKNWEITSKFIHQRGLMFAQSARNHSGTWMFWRLILEYTQERNPSPALPVTDHLLTNQHCKKKFKHVARRRLTIFISDRNEHMNLHSGDRPYKCDVCQRRFKQRKSLRAHRCEDAQEEVFQCEVCGRQFINRKALALHRIHHETENGKNKEPQEKPFLCDVCARGFSNKYLLKAHQATHSEEKRFECPICHKRSLL